MEELRKRIQQDPYLEMLGITFEEIKEGSAKCSVTITERMVNFLGVPHGGLLFSLADAALSASSNMDHLPSLAINVSGSFLSKVNIGDKISSSSKRIHETRKTATYQMEVHHNEKLIASFQGMVYRSQS